MPSNSSLRARDRRLASASFTAIRVSQAEKGARRKLIIAGKPRKRLRDIFASASLQMAKARGTIAGCSAASRFVQQFLPLDTLQSHFAFSLDQRSPMSS